MLAAKGNDGKEKANGRIEWGVFRALYQIFACDLLGRVLSKAIGIYKEKRKSLYT